MKNSKKENRVLIFSAPSGSGKSTIVKHLIGKYKNLDFSISATSRAPRGTEQNGKEYYFLTTDQFRQYINEDKFVEYEEVYDGLFYGTLRSEVERIWNEERIVLFDIDVKGGINLKKLYGDNALSVFIKAPSLEILRERLVKRGTDTPEAIEKRVIKAKYELSFETMFDKVIVNDILSDCLLEAERITESFLEKGSTGETL